MEAREAFLAEFRVLDHRSQDPLTLFEGFQDSAEGDGDLGQVLCDMGSLFQDLCFHKNRYFGAFRKSRTSRISGGDIDELLPGHDLEIAESRRGAFPHSFAVPSPDAQIDFDAVRVRAGRHADPGHRSDLDARQFHRRTDDQPFRVGEPDHVMGLSGQESRLFPDRHDGQGKDEQGQGAGAAPH